MSITKKVFTSYGGLATWMTSHLVDGGASATEATTFFGGLTLDSNKITLFSDSEKTNKVLEIGYLGSDPYKCAKVYKTNSSSVILGSSNSPYTLSSATAWLCNGGVYLRLEWSDTILHILITKTNNGVTAVIANVVNGTSSDSSSISTRVAALSTHITSIARGDDTDTNKTITFQPDSQNQTELVPFTTYSTYGSVSYTPYAFFCRTGQYYGLDSGVISYNGVNYVTNGYWALKDLEVTS